MARSLTSSRKANGSPRGSGPRIAIVVSRYNRTVTDALERGALGAFQAAGLGGVVEVFDVAGAFETIAIAATAAAVGRFDAVVVLGCIIKGETNHDEILGHCVTRELATIARERQMPVGLGVLTVNTPSQALERAGLGSTSKRGRKIASDQPPEMIGNKGAEAMDAVLHSLGELSRLRAEPGAAIPSERPALKSPDKLAGGSAGATARSGVARVGGRS
ncbi:MAG: 6,7-dimethyl-8-ribityllumazine synthase [Phycisphaerales bacterium]|nr:6,7-dimethyl-8-ribityllumazine synthase [Phycisphaerales bacterium]